MTAKERFIKSQDGKTALNLLASEPFERAVEVAFQTYSESIAPSGHDFSVAAANGFRLDGAKRVLEVLRNIAEVSERKDSLKPTQLNHGI